MLVEGEGSEKSCDARAARPRRMHACRGPGSPGYATRLNLPNCSITWTDDWSAGQQGAGRDKLVEGSARLRRVEEPLREGGRRRGGGGARRSAPSCRPITQRCMHGAAWSRSTARQCTQTRRDLRLPPRPLCPFRRCSPTQVQHTLPISARSGAADTETGGLLRDPSGDSGCSLSPTCQVPCRCQASDQHHTRRAALAGWWSAAARCAGRQAQAPQTSRCHLPCPWCAAGRRLHGSRQARGHKIWALPAGIGWT